MVKVNVINGLTREKIVLKEGNGDSYRIVRDIPANGSYVVNVETEATYREFLFVESESRLQLKLSSDDCIELKEVKITGINQIGLEYISTPREPKRISQKTTDANIVETVSVWKWPGKFYKKITAAFSRTAPPQQGRQLQLQAAAPPPQEVEDQAASPVS